MKRFSKAITFLCVVIAMFTMLFLKRLFQSQQWRLAAHRALASKRKYIEREGPMSNAEVTGLDWSAQRLVPAFQAPQHLDVYDIRHASPDVQLAVATMAGIINRPQPKVYLFVGDDDVFWLRQVFGSVPQDTAPVANDDTLEALLIAYRSSIQGLIIYDPDLADTVNVATTLAGQRDGIVVSPTQAQDLQQRYKLPVLVDLRTYKWRTRLQAYDWARQNLLKGSSSRLVAGLNPTNRGGLRSFAVATRTFVYWLDSRQYLPDLSNGLLSERSLMQQILSTFPAGATHIGWFIDESSGVSLTSQAAISVLATDLFFNLEVWTAVQPQTIVAPVQAQSHLNSVTSSTNTVYVSFMMSDGDNLQYSQHRMLKLWRDNARGSLPIGWTISPALVQAAPTMVAYYFSTATPHDEFIAGPSGAGYMFPSHWPSEHLSAFLQQTGQLMQAMKLTTFEVLDTNFWESAGLPMLPNIRRTGMAFTDEGVQQRFVQALVPYGLRGLFSGAGLDKVEWKKIDGIPCYRNLGLADSVAKTVQLIRDTAAAHSQRPLFLNVYILVWSMTPSDLKQVVEQLGPGYQLVLPSTLLALLAKSTS
jgi:hypothetical protein